MKSLALLLGLLLVLVGVALLLEPDTVMSVARRIITPVGLYVIAGARVAMGFVLIFAATESRAPKTLRALGALIVFAGLATPLFSVEQVHTIMDWALKAGTWSLRCAGVLVIAIGSFIALAVSPRGSTA